jgi:hypothetical protein
MKKEQTPFEKAIKDKRLNYNELYHYRYIGRYKNRDIFVNKITEVYLD